MVPIDGFQKMVSHFSCLLDDATDSVVSRELFFQWCRWRLLRASPPLSQRVSIQGLQGFSSPPSRQMSRASAGVYSSRNSLIRTFILAHHVAGETADDDILT